MEMVYYTIVAVLLYMISDWLLNRIEIRLGRRLRNRSMIFFVIILVLSLSSFSLISHLAENASPPKTADQPPVENTAGPASVPEPESIPE